MLYSLQIGRALAALAVVVHHSVVATQMVSQNVPDFWLSFLQLGYLGVDYFFVLSGFIIAHVTHGVAPSAQQAQRYAWTRALRIYVPYLPVALGLFVMLAVMDYLGMGGETRVPYSLMGSLLLVPSNDLPALSVAWTLQHEVLFYIVFGVCFFVLKDIRLLAVWGLGILGLLFFNVTDRWWNVVLGIINLEFLFGVVACYLYHAKWGEQMRHLLLLVGVVFVILAGYLLIDSTVIHYYRIIAGFGFAFIVLGLVHSEAHVTFGKARLLIFLGASSYAMYLVHAPLQSVLIKLMPALPYWYVTWLALTLLSCMAGVIYFKLIEAPLLRVLRKTLRLE